MESLKQIIQSLTISAEEKEALFKELKDAQKALESAEFRYKRTLKDKEAITNILNASLEEIGKQKKIIEEAKNEINKNLQELDRQKREADIEAALERVRAEMMSMRRSEDLRQVIATVFKQLQDLGFDAPASALIIYNRDLSAEHWMTGFSQDIYPESYKIPYNDHPYFTGLLQAWQNGVPFQEFLFEGDLKVNYAGWLFEHSDFKYLPEEFKKEVGSPERTVISDAYMRYGMLEVISRESLPEAKVLILKRFSTVIEQTYTRFLDIQKVEEQAREAKKQASLDRMRAEITSMRTTVDLERITPLIWNELTNMQVPFIRCGVLIIKEAKEQIEVYLSTPAGEAIAAFLLPITDKVDFIKQIYVHWQKKHPYLTHWDASDFVAWTETLVENSIVPPGERYSTEKPPDHLYLHFLPFVQGMLYVGNTAPLNEGEISLVHSLKEAFSTAYARYDDFTRLEAAKQQIEKALADLRATQAQLIQIEKMASLGELTAGIAHEIQNPLNFVNNFSEANKELIEELQVELQNRSVVEAIAISLDIKANEEKINYHGKRADNIVKAMLQHSRASSGQREFVNINQLAEEYLRLSYQGARTKDKSFTASIQTCFDESIGAVKVIPQDIGRVLLNLFNNAFYAVQQKKQRLNGQFEPRVEVSTRKDANEILITVKDNGIGIPENVLSKIYQPFFTTKPTGEGTGLGLSLSYDIITKGHGGELKVESRQGEGAAFVVHLPA